MILEMINPRCEGDNIFVTGDGKLYVVLTPLAPLVMISAADTLIHNRNICFSCSVPTISLSEGNGNKFLPSNRRL